MDAYRCMDAQHMSIVIRIHMCTHMRDIHSNNNNVECISYIYILSIYRNCLHLPLLVPYKEHIVLSHDTFTYKTNTSNNYT